MMRVDIRILSFSSLELAASPGSFLDLLLADLAERFDGETQMVRVQIDWTYRACEITVGVLRFGRSYSVTVWSTGTTQPDGYSVHVHPPASTLMSRRTRLTTENGQSLQILQVFQLIDRFPRQAFSCTDQLCFRYARTHYDRPIRER